MIEEPPPLAFAPSSSGRRGSSSSGLRGAPTSFVVDAMGGSGALDWRIKPIVGHSLLGVALTCDCGASDNLALVAAVAQGEPGDVLVAADRRLDRRRGHRRPVIGVARNRGAVGFVTDGLVRDLAALEALDMPVYAMGVSANSPGRRGPGTVGLPIVCGGRPIASGTSLSPIATASQSCRASDCRDARRLERVKAAEAASARARPRRRARSFPLMRRRRTPKSAK